MEAQTQYAQTLVNQTRSELEALRLTYRDTQCSVHDLVRLSDAIDALVDELHYLLRTSDAV